jgi:hypothetical protein
VGFTLHLSALRLGALVGAERLVDESSFLISQIVSVADKSIPS